MPWRHPLTNATPTLAQQKRTGPHEKSHPGGWPFLAKPKPLRLFKFVAIDESVVHVQKIVYIRRKLDGSLVAGSRATGTHHRRGSTSGTPRGRSDNWFHSVSRTRASRPPRCSREASAPPGAIVRAQGERAHERDCRGLKSSCVACASRENLHDSKETSAGNGRIHRSHPRYACLSAKHMESSHAN